LQSHVRLFDRIFINFDNCDRLVSPALAQFLLPHIAQLEKHVERGVFHAGHKTVGARRIRSGAVFDRQESQRQTAPDHERQNNGEQPVPAAQKVGRNRKIFEEWHGGSSDSCRGSGSS
jgi:hypothetical protein